MQEQTGEHALLSDTATSPIDVRPPISEHDTPYLFPHEHPDLPENIADWLKVRSYVIPQPKPIPTIDNLGPSNVVSGELKVRGQKDWAVYCTDRQKACIYIFGQGKVDNVDKIDKQPTRIGYKHTFSQQDLWCCSYNISVADSSFITTMYNLFSYPDDEELPLIEHQGLQFGVYGSGTYVLYYHKNQWLVFPGAD